MGILCFLKIHCKEIAIFGKVIGEIRWDQRLSCSKRTLRFSSWPGFPSRANMLDL